MQPRASNMFVEFILFLIAIFLVFYVPGKWLIDLLSYKSTNLVSSITVSLGAGIACFLIGTYIFSWVQAPLLYLIILIPIIIFKLPSIFQHVRRGKSLRWVISPETLIILCGSFILVQTTFQSGLLQNGSRIFYGINGIDGLFSVALINSFMFHFPPSFPGLSQTVLRGYHFFYYFLPAEFAILFSFNPFDLYYRFFSIFTAIFFGLTGLTVAYTYRMQSFTRRIFLFLLYFVQSAAFLLSYVFQNGAGLYDSPIVQSAGNIVDPSVLFAVSYSFLLFTVLFGSSKKKQLLLPILFLGILPQLKVHAGILSYIAVVGIGIVGILKKKYDYLYIILGAGLVSAVVYLPLNMGAGSLIFAPFLVVSHFFESQRLFAPFQWALKMQVYQMHHNIPRIVYLYSIALAAFLIPPLGIRLVMLTQIKTLFLKKFYTSKNLFWFIYCGVGFILPLFFIQSVGAFNIIQLYWIIWITFLIPTAFSIQRLVGVPSKIKVDIVFTILILLSLPTLILPSVRSLIHERKPDLIVSADAIETGRFLKNSVPREDAIIVLNRSFSNGGFSNAYQIPMFAVLAQRPMFYEPQITDFTFASSTLEGRRAIVDKISLVLAGCSTGTNDEMVSIMKALKARYVLAMQDNSCLSSLPGFTRVFERGNYQLYHLQ